MFKIQYLIISIITLGIFCGISQVKGQPKLICYFSNWVSPYKKPFQYNETNIPFELCDSLVWYHDTISTNDAFSIENRHMGIEYEMNFLRIATRNRIPIYLAIGGYGMNLTEFSKLRFPEKRMHFFENIRKKMMSGHLYTGLLIDWGYPGMNSHDSTTYTEILELLYPEFQKRNWTLAITGASDRNIIEKGYDLYEINKYVDEIHVNCHHFPDFFTRKAKDHSPLHSDADWLYSVENVMNNWNLGIPNNKLYVAVYILGVTRGSERPEAHFEVCTYLMSGTLKEEWNSVGKVAHAENQFVDVLYSYENVQSLQEKARFVKSKGYGGIAFKFINDDDFRGICGRENALLKSIRKVFDEQLK